jgi:hypothetical protein
VVIRARLYVCISLVLRESLVCFCKTNRRANKYKARTYQGRGAQIFQKCSIHLKILGVRKVTWREFHYEEPHNVHNFVARGFYNRGLTCSGM